MSELPHDPIDELLHRAHNAADGAPPEFMGRLRARFAAEAVARKRARMVYIQSAVAAAAVIILALVIGLNVEWFFPHPEPVGQPGTAEASDTPAGNTPALEPRAPDMRPEPQPKPEGNTAPEPDQPEPGPAQPDDPKPEPKKPDDVVDQPTPEKPEPKDPQPVQPEPKQPDDTVEKPEPVKPTEPDGTEVKPPQPKTGAVLASVIAEPKLRIRYEGEAWHDYAGEELHDGVRLSAGRDAVSLTLADGGLAYFDGEVRLSLDGEVLCFSISTDNLYIDNLDTAREVKVVAERFSAGMSDAVAAFFLERSEFEVAALVGSASLGGETIEAGNSRRASSRGIGNEKAFKGDRFLKDVPERILLREDFDQPPPGGMYGDGERLEDGVAVMDKAPRYIAFRYNPTLTVLPGMVVRIRYRTTDVNKLELELFTLAELKLLKKNKETLYKRVFSPARNGEWQEIEFRVDKIADNDDPNHFPSHGELFRNFKLHFSGGDKAKLEIDTVEFVRVQDPVR
ncbi:MAG: hypothetical protein KDB90_16755 [Planctomycetes bacterium]|nr:hypothetical protein [Planctomycetota bacterium]